MAHAGTGDRTGRWRTGLIVAAAFLLGLGTWITLRPEPPAAPPPAAPPPAAPPPVAAAAPPAPSFDVVRVSPQGDAVIAGRAAPGAEVVVRDGTQEIARTQADRQGSFVAIPAAPLAPGGRALTLTARTGSGAEARGDGAVMLVVPAPAAPAEAPPSVVAVLVPERAPPRVLQQTRPAGQGTPEPGAQEAGAHEAGKLGLDTVDYDDRGSIRFTGHAGPGSRLRAYLDNLAVGDATATATGVWGLTPSDAVAPGVHALRVDRLDEAGRVLSRIELPFQRTALAAAELASAAAGHIVVQPGQNLWRMARSAYGSGVRYTVIYLANREQIRDPGRIYPGQAFSVPQPAR